ncbi:MAG TPA: biotin--[acetyl-CoA-carboxylase] ligase [Clostridiales bacterium]|nr:MAG: biotin--[acetyl-CoA-carboxylase] ligase [Clostridiales bacterium GWD2_32_19]HCC08346.1 biotin--[acetyl-CoA-carboxylase] ligase [Clostridiales bacterium]
MNIEQELQEYKIIGDLNKKVIFYDEIDSTNEEAKRLIRAGKIIDGALVTELQIAGKGTQGKKWLSTSGTSILMTIIKKTKQDIQEVQGVTISIGEMVHEVLSGYLPERDVKIKHPNDIIVNGKKICGILVESIKHNDELYLIIGIGINVNTDKFEEIEGNVPTSLYLETGRVHSRKEIVLEIINNICK